MVYQQAVSAEDVFLGMGNKNPTTASCEDLVVRTDRTSAEFTALHSRMSMWVYSNKILLCASR